MNARITAYLKSEGVMKKFLQVFTLCALCVLAAPMVFAVQNKNPVHNATKDTVYNVVLHIRKSSTVKLSGEIDADTIFKISAALLDNERYI